MRGPYKINHYNKNGRGIEKEKTPLRQMQKKPTTPISQELLTLLIRALHKVCNSEYEAKMFSATFSLAYFSMLRKVN